MNSFDQLIVVNESSAIGWLWLSTTVVEHPNTPIINNTINNLTFSLIPILNPLQGDLKGSSHRWM
jgi:hypothetical protein